MLFMERLEFSVLYVKISLNDWCSTKFVEFNAVVLLVSHLLFIVSLRNGFLSIQIIQSIMQ